MIQILTLLSSKLGLTTIFSFIKKYNKVIAVFIIAIFIAIFCFMRKQLNIKDAQIGRLNNNCLYYLELNSNNKQSNRALQLTINDFKLSLDSLLQVIRNKQKELNIKDKSLKQALLLQQVIKLDTTIIINQKDSFAVVIKPNELTTLSISKKDSILNAKIDIRNTLILYILNKKEYRNKYKNWFTRLIHFDFKKDNNYKYQINNSNSLIKIEDTRIVELSE